MRTLTVLLAVFFMDGCGKTAIIHKKDGTFLEAEIRRGDASSIYVFSKGSGGGDLVEGFECRVFSKRGDKDEVLANEFQCRDSKSSSPWGHPRVLARQTYQYNEDGSLESVELDFGADGSVEERKTFIYNGDGKLLQFEGNESADAELSMDRIKDSLSCNIHLADESAVEVPVGRACIHDIDHPGDIAAVIGTSLTAMGVSLLLGFYLSQCEAIDRCDNMSAILIGVPGGILALLGISIGTPGWVSWLRSKSVAAQPDEPRKPKLSPVALTDGERTYYGLGLSWRW